MVPPRPSFDAYIDRLLKDPQLRDDPPATEPFGLPLREDEAKLALSNSRNAPDTGAALAKIREACGDDFLVGEVYLPSVRWQPYSDHFDAVFAFAALRFAKVPMLRQFGLLLAVELGVVHPVDQVALRRQEEPHDGADPHHAARLIHSGGLRGQTSLS